MSSRFIWALLGNDSFTLLSLGARRAGISALADVAQTRMQQEVKTAKTPKPRRPKASQKPVGN